jgi:hypothetical protein
MLTIAFITGFILGGPVSAVLAGCCLYILRKLARRNRDALWTWTKTDLFIVLAIWAMIGSLAMPVSWFIGKSMGWNLDVLAVIQSGGKFKSYQDWSESEEMERQLERARRKNEREEKRAKERRLLDLRLKAQAEEEERKRQQVMAEEHEKERRIYAELEKLRDPERRRQSDERHLQHLNAVGCIDDSGQVVRNLFCMNTEAPPE